MALQETQKERSPAAGGALRTGGEAKPIAFGRGLLSTASIMHTAQSVLSRRKLRNLVLGSLVFTGAASLLVAQVEVKKQKPASAKIESQLIVVGESVVREQWAHTLKLVNAPENVTLLNPGQCIRVGIVSTGDNRDSYLEKTKVAFRVNFSGHSQDHPMASFTQFKQMKPVGGDFVTAALAAGGIKNPMLTMAILGVSAENWCVPVDASDSTATVEAEVEAPDGHQTLKPATIQIESYGIGSKKLFKDIQELNNFSQDYYRQPNPARLLPALQAAIAEQTDHPESNFIQIFAAFQCAALKADPAAAKDFMARITSQPPSARAFGLLILRSAGYDIDSALKTMSPEEQEKVTSLPPLDDPYDLTPTRAVFTHLDLMWATFGATGQFKPVETIASTLSWRPDYDEFDKVRNAPDHHLTLTPSIVRGVAYTAAGWSLGSFQRNDPLASDYIEYMLASPDTSPTVKSELNALSTNPAFQQSKGK